MGISRSKDAIYDLKFHLVWIPKYRKHILGGRASSYWKEVFKRISEEYGFEIDTMEVVEDHVHVFLGASPRYSPSQLVQIMKSISAKEVFKEFSDLRKQLLAGELWNDGYFVRNVGDEVTADIIRRYVKYQNHEDDSNQLSSF